MKKVISILVSVLMILTAMPAFADGTEAAAASVDIYEALDNFSAEELATTYTENLPYTNGAFSAPAGTAQTNLLNVTVHEDDENGDYVHIVPQESAYTNTSTVTAGAWVKDESLNIGSGNDKNSKFVANFKFRYKTNQKNLFMYLVDKDGKNTYSLFKLWTSDRLDIANGSENSYGNFSVNLSDDTWYDITINGDVSTGALKFFINGGAYVNKVITSNRNAAGSSVTYSGIRLGWNSALNGGANEYFDIANMSLSNTASFEYDETLTFDEGTITNFSSAWTQGSWQIAKDSFEIWSKNNYIALNNKTVDYGNSLNLIDGGASHLYINHILPENTVNSDGVLVVEGSTIDDHYSHMHLALFGTSDGVASTELVAVTNRSSSSWDVAVLGDYTDDNGATIQRPKNGVKGWIRTRLILNLSTNTLIFQQWEEANPTDTLITATRTNALDSFSDITRIDFRLYTNWGDMWVDNLRVYTADTLRYIGSNPVNGAANAVSVTANPSLFFNMPIASTTATASNVTLTDSQGNSVAGTVGLSAQRNGISFYPASDLKPEETYTLTANCAVSDEFGSTVNVSKTITFTTEPLLSLVNFEFTKDGATATEVTAGDLSAAIEVKSKDKLARSIYAALAIYNKTTGELVSINTDTINAVSNTFNLSAIVPSTGTYYAKAFVWNTEALAAPYFTVESLGLSN